MRQGKAKILFVPNITRVIDLVAWVNHNRYKNINTRKLPAKTLILDFSRAKFLKPYHIAPLACLVHEYQVKGYSVAIKNTSETIKEYLRSFSFYEFCKKDHNNDFPETASCKTFPLWKIDKEKISIYPNQVQDFFERNHFDGKSLFSIGVSLSELMNNIFDHSGSKIPGYTFTPPLFQVFGFSRHLEE